ncbi:MAG: hybrid sensor histidine kinase/response regulator [Bradymonadales bacterium]|nr:hybrid sensor histidine kinase/response regulator [Bradymonadales bacterium]
MTPSPGQPTAPERERILVVDDEFGIREGCRRVLTSEGYQVQTAADGLEGLETFRQEKNFAAALIDLKMPRMGGLELIDAIRKEDPDIMLLVITAYATIQTAVEATKKGAYGYIPKPFTPDELLLPLRNGLEKRSLALEAKRLRAERERRLLEITEERSKLRTIIECMTDGVAVVNQDKQVVLENAALARFLPEARPNSWPAPMAALGYPELISILEEALKAGTAPLISSTEITLDNRTYMVNASPVAEPGHDPFGAVAVVREITAIKQLAVAKSMFISMVAHELKSPLAAIEAFLDLILSRPESMTAEKQQEMMERCVLRARNLRNMVTELLNLVAIETGHLSLKRTPIELGSVVEEVVELQRPKAEAKQLEMILDLPEQQDTTQVLADKEALSCIITNLVDNAIKYTPDQGRVDVSVSCDEHLVKLAVRDSGIGMTEKERESAFDEFYRAKNKHTASIPGTGLGLSVVKRLVEMHNGVISLASEPGQGSTFTISFQSL